MLSQVRCRSDHTNTLDDDPGRKVCAVHKEEGCCKDGDPPEDDNNKSRVLAAEVHVNFGTRSGDKYLLVIPDH